MEIGMIALWSGSIATIPANHQLCDGTNGTPDLREKFIRGAGPGAAVDAEGGSDNHNHTGTTDGHSHLMAAGSPNIAAGTDIHHIDTTTDTDTITTANADTRPTFYTLAWIQRMA